MEKRLIILIISVQFGLNSFSQDTTKHVSHSCFISLDNWTWRDTHTFYGYQLGLKKHYFEIGLSLERKRLIYFYEHPSRMYNEILSPGDSRPYYYKDSSFSFIPTGVMIGYSYIFKPESKLTAYPFIRNYAIYYSSNGNFIETDSNGITTEYKYKINQWQFSFQWGCGFRLNLNNKIMIRNEFGIGTYYKRDFFESDYLGVAKNFRWPGFTGFLRLSITYKFK